MVLKKQELLHIIDQFPDEVDVERLMHQLYLKAKLDRSEQAAAEGKILTQQQLEQEVKQWGS